ncbi:hypothetical protein C8R47DRAFT_582838 [Mycena vitilis]|nr:hypothetical protein C8R47DRAFT_582838 [Mycena vitilis]
MVSFHGFRFCAASTCFTFRILLIPVLYSFKPSREKNDDPSRSAAAEFWMPLLFPAARRWLCDIHSLSSGEANSKFQITHRHTDGHKEGKRKARGREVTSPNGKTRTCLFCLRPVPSSTTHGIR